MDLTRLERLHVVARDCRADLLDDAAIVEAAVRAVESVGFEMVSSAVHAFVPHGLTVVLVLAQSHCAISTWPEFGCVTFDATLCGDAAALQAMWQRIADHLQPSVMDETPGSDWLVGGEI